MSNSAPLQPTRAIDLSDCSEFKQTLQAHVPILVHASAILLVCLVGAVVTWSAFTRVNLVVRGHGRVRSADLPHLVYIGTTNQQEARVVEVTFREGDSVKRGDVLIRFDTRQLENSVARLKEMLICRQEEIDQLEDLLTLTTNQFAAATAKAEAESAEWQQQIEEVRKNRLVSIDAAIIARDLAQDRLDRTERLLEARAASVTEWRQAKSDLDQAELELKKAQMPINESRELVLQRAIELIDRDHEVRIGELNARIDAKRSEIKSLQRELSNLHLQIEKTIVLAPIDGIVTAGNVKVGDILPEGEPVAEIAENRRVVFEASVANQDMAQLKPGMPVQIRFDAYDQQTYGIMTGRVEYISPDSRVSPSEQGSRAVYGVKVAMDGTGFSSGHPDAEVKLGMTGTAEIVTDRQSLLHVLARQMRRTISF